MLKFSCPKCGQHFDAEDDFAGQQVQCTRCGTLFNVTGNNTAAVSGTTSDVISQCDETPQPASGKNAKDYTKAIVVGVILLLFFVRLINASIGKTTKQTVDASFSEIKQAAQKGNAEAQYQLALFYEKGDGVTIDRTEAVKWFRKAAEQGFAKAQFSLGNCYVFGDGVAENAIEAVKWFRKAAEQGFAKAQFSLGNCYVFGDGVAENAIEAVKWYRKAAEQGNCEGQYALALCYDNGWGVPEDKTEADKWYREAAKQGHQEAQDALGDGKAEYKRGLICLSNNETEAIRLFHRAARKGYAEAQFQLGVCYDRGYGVGKDKQEALKWYREAANQGHEPAKAVLRERGEL